MDNKNLILLGVLGFGAYYMMNQQKQQQYPGPGTQPYSPGYTYQPNTQQPSTIDKINNTIADVNKVIDTGKSIWDSVSGLFSPKTTPNYTPVNTPPPIPAGSWA